MKKQLLIVGIIILLMVVGLSGCSNNPFDTEKNKFVGTWKTNSTDLSTLANLGSNVTFFSDGTFTLGYVKATYEVKDGKFVVTVSGEGGNLQYDYDYSFSNSNTILTITPTSGGSSVIYTKQ